MFSANIWRVVANGGLNFEFIFKCDNNDADISAPCRENRVFRKITVAEIRDSLCKALVNSFGDSLVSVIKYGSTVGLDPGQPVSREQNLRVLIVVEQMDADLWNRASSAFDQIKGRANLFPMLMTVGNLHSSTDVFPITFLEMQRNYEVLHGKDVLQDLEIQKAHLRLRCEQELKNLHLRMQSTCLMHHATPRRLKNALTRNYESFLRAIGGAVCLTGGSVVGNEEALIETAIESFQLDRDTLAEVASAVASDGQHDAEWIRALYISMMSVVQAAADHIDQMQESVMVIDPVESGE